MPLSSDTNPWARYAPDTSAPWDLRRVVHLHRRAGFAASWAEIRRDLDEGPDTSIGRVLDGKAGRDGGPEDFESTSTILADAAAASGDPERLRAWWVFRMLGSPDPLGERLTLMWHSHFASAQSKVDDLGLMRRQNETFRRQARAPFATILNEAIREPALLVYLDAAKNHKDRPNENLARELLELFTLGIGHYTESDVRESARALTGWTVEDDAFRIAPPRHDDSPKVILGREKRWNGADLIAALACAPATAERLARRLCDTFMGERAVDDAAVAALAGALRATGFDVGQAVATIVRSRAFFDARNLGTRVIGPAEFVVGACRALLPRSHAPSTLILASWIGRMGQELFEPPNVAGWSGGRAWLTPRALVARSNFAVALAEGRGIGLPGPIDAGALAAEQGLGRSPTSVRRAAAAVLLGNAGADEPGSSRDSPEAARRALSAVLASPEAQLG